MSMRFRSTLTSDIAHMMPHEKGVAVATIHQALTQISLDYILYRHGK
jgi:hypothetical protein